MNRPKKGQSSGGKGGGMGLNLFSGLFGGGQNQEQVKFQDPTLNATDEGGKPTTIPNSAYNPNAPAYPAQKSFMGLWNYTPRNSQNLANQINTTIGTQVAAQNALQPGELAGKQKELQIQANQSHQNEQYESGLYGQSIANAMAAGKIPASSIPSSGGDYSILGRDYKNFYGQSGQQGIGGAQTTLDSLNAGNQANSAKALYDTTLTQGKQPFAADLGKLQGQGDIQTLIHGLAQGQLQNKLVNDPQYQSSYLRGQTALAGEPAVRKVNAGERIYDPNLGVQYTGSSNDSYETNVGGVEYPPGSGNMIGGKPVTLSKINPGSVNPYGGAPRPLGAAGKAALEGTQTIDEGEGDSKFDTTLPQKPTTIEQPNTTPASQVQDVIKALLQYIGKGHPF